jgi:uncharacterized protein (DUF305 family)
MELRQACQILILTVGMTASAVALAQSRPAATTPKSAASGAQSGASHMHDAMMSGMREMEATKPSGNVDRDFAIMMRFHHQQAIDMARVQLQQGKSAELKAMSRAIIREQQKEIAQLDRWLKWRTDTKPHDSGSH